MRWWSLINTSTSPGERLSNTLDYDSESDKVIFFGGRPGKTSGDPAQAYLNDTWAFHSPINTPSAPINPQALLLENNSVNITWDPPSTTINPPITSYKIFRGNESGTLELYQVVDSLSYIDNSVIHNQS